MSVSFSSFLQSITRMCSFLIVLASFGLFATAVMGQSPAPSSVLDETTSAAPSDNNTGCLGTAAPCFSNSECCSDTCDGVCIDCIPDGGVICSKDSNCCDDLVCDDGTCIHCDDNLNIPCSENADCCESSGHICYAGLCEKCSNTHTPCVSDQDCCGSTKCEAAFCGGPPSDCSNGAVWCCDEPFGPLEVKLDGGDTINMCGEWPNCFTCYSNGTKMDAQGLCKAESECQQSGVDCFAAPQSLCAGCFCSDPNKLDSTAASQTYCVKTASITASILLMIISH